MTDQFQASDHEEYDEITESNDVNFHQVSNTSDFESASALFDESGVVHKAQQGVLKATAQLDNGLIEVNGLQLPRDVAEKMGIVAPSVQNEINYAVDVQNQTETAEESTDVLDDLPMLDEAQTSLLDQAMAFDGGSVTAAVRDILAHGDLQPNTLEDLARASGADADAVNSTIEAVSTNLDAKIEQLSGVSDASEMLRLASESQPNLVKSAIMASINGDVSSALDLAKQTYSNLDTTSYRGELEHTLTENGYRTYNKNGRLYVSGNELPDPVAWSTACSLFSLDFID